MISKNIPSTNNPFLLRPVGKDYLWGGNRLNEDFSKDIDIYPLAETWECSIHPDGESIVATGEFAGMTLSDVIALHPEYLGTNMAHDKKIPILVKFIDANKDLSVQVHPDDEYAKKYENGQHGKSEMWYVLDATADAKLVYGFNHDVDKDTIRKSIEDGTVEKYLQKVGIKKDDVFFIPAGTVHAIGKGALIAEIQQNSNLTYRMYDYNRVDKKGKKRELHIDKALDVANLNHSDSPRQPMRVLKYSKGCASEKLCRCQYFQVNRLLINTERYRNMADFQSGPNSFRVLLCTSGCGIISYNENDFIKFFKGDCIFVPANSVPIKIHGRAQMLDVEC